MQADRGGTDVDGAMSDGAPVREVIVERGFFLEAERGASGCCGGVTEGSTHVG
jgi:hypothetical protein